MVRSEAVILGRQPICEVTSRSTAQVGMLVLDIFNSLLSLALASKLLLNKHLSVVYLQMLAKVTLKVTNN